MPDVLRMVVLVEPAELRMLGDLAAILPVDAVFTVFRKAGALLADEGVDLLIVPARRLRFNPLEVPPGVSPTEWASRASELLVQTLELPPRATKLSSTHVHQLYERHDVFADGEDYPTLHELRNTIDADRKANAPARDAVVDSLAPVLVALNETIACRRGWSVAELAKHAILFDLTGLTRTAQNLLLGGLLLAEFTRRLALGHSNAPLDLLVCLDEAQRLISMPGASQNAFADLWPLIRGTGVGLDLSIPTGHGLMPEALSFTGAKWLGRFGSAADYHTFGAAMGLSHEQITWATHNLTAGVFIYQASDSDWRYPCVAHVPNVTSSSKIDTDAEHLGPLATLPVVPATSAPSRSVAPVLTMQLDARSCRFCKAVLAQPLLASSAYPKLAGVSVKAAMTIRRTLVAQGLIRERTIDPAGRGRPAVLLEPTPATAAAVEAHENQGEAA